MTFFQSRLDVMEMASKYPKGIQSVVCQRIDALILLKIFISILLIQLVST